MSDVLGTEDARFTLPLPAWTSRWPGGAGAMWALPLPLRLIAGAAAGVLSLGVLTVVQAQPSAPTLVVAAAGLERLRADGVVDPVRLPAGQDPARLLRLAHATLVLTRPPNHAFGGWAFLLPDGSTQLRRLGPADQLAPDSRGDRVWLVRGAAVRSLQAYDGSGRHIESRSARSEHDLLLVTPDGVLDDEVVTPGGTTPTLRSDSGRVLRRWGGPVQVLDIVGPRLLVVMGNCLDGCTAQVWDVRLGAADPPSAPLDAGLVLLDGALSPDGRSVALAARSASAGAAMDGPNGQAVLLRGRLAVGASGGEPWSTLVDGGCTLLACHVAWSGDTVYASTDLSPGGFVRWDASGRVTRLSLRVPGVVDLASAR